MTRRYRLLLPLLALMACATEGRTGPRHIGKSALPDALYIHKGGAAPAPPAGDISIIYDTDSTLKTVDSTATKVVLGGGGAGTGIAATLAASTSNISLSGTQTIDGVAVIAGNRVLVAGETDQTTNGVYVVASGAWSRSSDFATSNQMVSGSIVPVISGALFGGSLWTFTASGTITVGSTNLTFVGPQPSNNVAFTGGSESGMSLQGFTSTQVANDLGVIDGGWLTAQYTQAKTAVPNVTRCKEIPLMMIPPSGQAPAAVTSDAFVEGGGLNPNSSTRVLTGSVFQNLAGGNWVVMYRGACATLTTGIDCEFGVTKTADASTSIYIGATNATSSTKFIGSILGAGTTTTLLSNADNAFHNWMISDDGTTEKYWIDGVVAGSTTTRTNISSAAPSSVYIYGQSASTRGTRAAFCYIEP